MATENDPTIWTSVVGFVVLMFGWLFHRTNTANNIANQVSGKLSEYYMKREEVRTDIREAREDLRHDMGAAVGPIVERLSKIEASLDSLMSELRNHKR